MGGDIDISIVSPVYRSEQLVSQLVAEVKEHVSAITERFEIILVEDGSPENCWEEITKETEKDRRVKGIRLSRNFGQHYAITAGLDRVKGEWVVVMDCDLQDLPSEIPNLFKKANEGYDIVLARRGNRRDGFFKRMSSKLFYWILSYLSGTRQDSTIANFGLYHRKVINAVVSMREKIRYFPTMINWVGFRKTYLDVQHGKRPVGKSSYGFRRLTNLALDILLANSEKPIRIIVKLGFFVSVVSFTIGLITLVRYFSGAIEVLGYTSLIVSVWFIGGVIMMIMGMVGLYVGKIFQNVKNRPIYIVSEEKNTDVN